MPWQLTTPLNTGDLDSGTYSQIKISSWQHDPINEIIIISLDYGNTVDNNWIRGIHPATKQTSIVIESDDYDDLIANSSPGQGETTYEAVKRGLYEYLETAEIIGPGSVI